jgi:hypothetical protein
VPGQFDDVEALAGAADAESGRIDLQSRAAAYVRYGDQASPRC